MSLDIDMYAVAFLTMNADETEMSVYAHASKGHLICAVSEML